MQKRISNKEDSADLVVKTQSKSDPEEAEEFFKTQEDYSGRKYDEAAVIMVEKTKVEMAEMEIKLKIKTFKIQRRCCRRHCRFRPSEQSWQQTQT